MSVLLVLEESGGKIKRASWEALAAAHRLAPAQEITAVVIGAETDALAAEAAAKPRAIQATVVSQDIRCSRRIRRMDFPSHCISSSETRATRSGWYFRTRIRCAITRRRLPAGWARC